MQNINYQDLENVTGGSDPAPPVPAPQPTRETCRRLYEEALKLGFETNANAAWEAAGECRRSVDPLGPDGPRR